ncbi:hypothetical protein Q7P37_009875 [Cladosporium fusiforme]
MQTSIPVLIGNQYFPSPCWTWQQGYQLRHVPTTRLNASDFEHLPAATQGFRSVHRLPPPQELSAQQHAKGKASSRLSKLLPASAKLSIASSTPIVVSCLGNKWLANLLKRLKKIHRRDDKAMEHRTILADLLGGGEAIWVLASIMLPAVPDVESLEHSDQSVESTTESRVIHIRGKVLYVDLLDCQEVCFKLTDETIEALLGYHDEVHCTNLKTSGIDYNDVEARLEMAKNEYHRAIHAFTFRINKQCLQEMQDDGSGELSFGRPGEAKTAIMALFKPLPEILTPRTDINALFPASKIYSYSKS